MRPQVEKAASVVLCVCALAITVVAVRGEYSPERGPAKPPRPRYVKEWREMLSVGQVIAGDPAAPVKVVEFADLECPFCRQFQATIRETIKRHPRDIAFILIHFPLSGHRFARPAARAVECAGREHVGQIVDVIYRFQDSLGLRPWTWYAGMAGISDTASFARCADDPSPRQGIEAGRSLAERLEINSTPTVVVNGWLYQGGVGLPILERAIEAVRKGKAIPGSE